jgi:PAS domain S-box-containing protein
MQLTLQRARNLTEGYFPNLVLAALVLVGLFQISRFSYLLFHSLAELFSIVIAYTIFVLTWNARRIINNGYLLFLGISFLAVGMFDLLHTLAFAGMGIFPGTDINLPEGPNLATQLWLAARYTQALSLLIAPVFLRVRFRAWPVASAFTLLSVLVLLSIFSWGIFPDSYVGGLTPFKIYSEYAIMVFFLVSMLLLVIHRRAFDPTVRNLLLASTGFMVVAEFAFTGYLGVYDFFNLIGHYFKIVAFYLIYKAIIVTGFLKPHELLFRELTESEQALREITQSERARAAQLEAIMEAVPAVVWLTTDPQARRITGNRAAAEFLRMSSNDNLSLSAESAEAPTHFRVFHDGAELKPDELVIQSAAASGQPVRDYEETVIFDDGEERHLIGNVTPLLEDGGQPAGAVGAFIDITARVMAERALQRSEQRYRGLFQTMTEGFLLLGIIRSEDGQPHDFRISEVNPAFEELVGQPRETLIGQTLRQRLRNAAPDWIDHYIRVAQTGESVRFEGFRPDLGKYLEVLIYRVSDRECASLTIDVTQRHRDQEALRQSEARLRRLVDSNIIGVIYAGAEGEIALANEAFLQIAGCTRDELQGGVVNWRSLTPEEYRALDDDRLAEAKERGGSSPYTKEFIRKDGSRVPVLVGYAYFPETAAPYVCFVIDLTQQKEAENAAKAYAAQLERSNRELEEFAFVASHDLQEPLRKIQAFGERIVIMNKDKLDDESEDYLLRLSRAAERMRSMIQDLLSLSRVTTHGVPFERLNLNRLVEEVLSDLELQVEQSGGVVEVENLPAIQGDPTQIRQLFQNLIGNALKFHRPGVPPHVRLYAESPPGEQNAIIYVKDNGIGFDQQYLERIFLPFQRLHGRGEYEGSGIGLAVCRKIADRHGGSITATSQPDQGTTFIISLPARQVR